jgi:hypothetical protein
MIKLFFKWLCSHIHKLVYQQINAILLEVYLAQIVHVIVNQTIIGLQLLQPAVN